MSDEPKVRTIELGAPTLDQQYTYFVVVVYASLDFDDKADADAMLRYANQFEALRKLWVGNEPIEDKELQGFVLEFYTTVKQVSSEMCLQVERALDLLSQFCLEKHRAIHRRSRGADAAEHYEAAAVRAYNQLPSTWKW